MPGPPLLLRSAPAAAATGSARFVRAAAGRWHTTAQLLGWVVLLLVMMMLSPVTATRVKTIIEIGATDHANPKQWQIGDVSYGSLPYGSRAVISKNCAH
jgi:hypothetical protein